MTTHRFDRLSKTFATRLSRRAAVQATGIGLAAGALGVATAQEATPEAAATDPEFLFVQTAMSGTFVPNPDAGTPAADGTPVAGGGAAYLLTLEGHGGGTVYFSDRPERIFGEAPTGQFLDGLGFSPDNPPNAALVTQTGDGTEDVAVLELFDPAYDEAAGTVTYGATILDAYTGEGLAHLAARQDDAMPPETFGRASLFIDDCVSPQAIYCIAGDSYVVIGNVGYQSFSWSIRDNMCEPVGGWDTLAVLCNRQWPECDDACQGCTEDCTQPRT